MNSKNKGGVFERDCSRMLSLWWTDGKRDDAIWRSASSGALTTVGKGRYLAHTGDFAATDAEAAPLFDRVIIEAKRGYNRYSVQDLLDIPGDKQLGNPASEMLYKLDEVCRTQGKWGLILWKRDRRGTLAITMGRRFVFPELAPHLEGRVGILHFHVLPWQAFEISVSANQIMFLPATPVASSSCSSSTSS